MAENASSSTPWLLILTTILLVLKFTVAPTLPWWLVFMPVGIGVIALTVLIVVVITAWVSRL